MGREHHGHGGGRRAVAGGNVETSQRIVDVLLAIPELIFALAIAAVLGPSFANIIFEGLLFMAMGAVLLRTGTCKGSELGGLYKSMPLTTAFCIVGAASISAFPFLSGFVTKSMILDEAAAGGHTIAWLVLLFASAGFN